MTKRLAALILLMLVVMGAFAQSSGTKQLYRLVKDTYETKADSMTNAFIESFMIKTKGYFNVSRRRHLQLRAAQEHRPSAGQQVPQLHQALVQEQGKQLRRLSSKFLHNTQHQLRPRYVRESLYRRYVLDYTHASSHR